MKRIKALPTREIRKGVRAVFKNSDVPAKSKDLRSAATMRMVFNAMVAAEIVS